VIAVVAAHALRESLRRRVFVVVLVLSAAFLLLYAWGVSAVFGDVDEFGANEFGVDGDTLAGGTVLGLSMFVTLFLGAVLSTFLTLGAVRGDAERGLLQPIIVRPLGRTQYVAGRLLAAAAVSAGYVVALFLACVVVTGLIGWWPDRILGPAVALAAGAVVLAGLGVLGSVLLSTTANGIAIFMLFGAGITAGLLQQIGEALESDTLEDVGRVVSWALPFEALYQHGLALLTADVEGTTEAIVNLGPFGGAQEAGAGLWVFTALYLAAAFALAARLFARRDL
jgi:Cu-processing system permease protein